MKVSQGERPEAARRGACTMSRTLLLVAAAALPAMAGAFAPALPMGGLQLGVQAQGLHGARQPFGMAFSGMVPKAFPMAPMARVAPGVALQMADKAAGGDRGDKGSKGSKRDLMVKTATRLYAATAVLFFSALRKLATIQPSVLALTVVVLMFLPGLVRKPMGPDGLPVKKPVEVGYSMFLDGVADKKVAGVTLGQSNVVFQLTDGRVLTTRIPRASPDLINLLHDKKVPFSQGRATAGQMLLPYIGLMLYLGVVGFFGWQMLGKNLGGGGAGKRVQSGQLDQSLGLQDVAGIDKAKAQMMQVVDVMKNPAKYQRLGARQPAGLLLVGPPGTGKTLLARVVAISLGLPFFYASGSDFVEMFVGRGASRVRDLFARATKAAQAGGAVIFIDELDALGKSRSSGMQMMKNDEGEQTLNQLLACMDGIDTKGNGLVVIAATNRYDVLDDALTRPGRFDRVIRVPLPDRDGREKVLMVHGRRTVLGKDINFSKIADQTEGFSPAELANLVNEAVIEAADRAQPTVRQANFDSALYDYRTSRQKGGFLGRSPFK